MNAAEQEHVLSTRVPYSAYRALEVLQEAAGDRAPLGLQVAVLDTVRYVAELARDLANARMELAQLRGDASAVDTSESAETAL